MLNLWGEEEEPKPEPTWESKDERRREKARQREKRRWEAGNPMVKRFGMGPQHLTCRTCYFLVRDHHQSAYYYKCEIRGISRGTATDHRVGWPACAKYKAK